MNQLPNNWQTVSLRYISECLDGKRIPLNSEERGSRQGEYPYWGANGIVDYVDEYLFNESLVLLGEDGAPFFDKTKPVAFLVEDKVWVNNHIHVLRIKNGTDSKFVVYSLNATDYGQSIDGSTRDKLTQQNMGSIKINFPPLPEQRAIADYLDRETARLDSLIAAKERLLELLAEKRRAVITHAVTRGLNPNVSMRDSGVEWLGEIPSHWEVKRIRNISSGKLTNGLFKSNEQFGSGTKLVNVFDIYRDDFKVDFESLERVKASEDEIERYSVSIGDLFFVRSSLKAEGIAASAYVVEVKEPAVFESHIIRLRVDSKKMLSSFLAYYLNSTIARSRLASLSTTTTMTTISQPEIQSLKLPVPPLQEQVMIVKSIDEQLGKFNQLSSATQKTVNLLHERRVSLIAAAVSGQVAVSRN